MRKLVRSMIHDARMGSPASGAHDGQNTAADLLRERASSLARAAAALHMARAAAEMPQTPLRHVTQHEEVTA